MTQAFLAAWNQDQDGLGKKLHGVKSLSTVAISALLLLPLHSYACTKNGHLFEFHYKRIVVKRVWHLLPGEGGGVAINALYLHEAFCVTGSEDGVLRLWPLDFSTVFLEAGMFSDSGNTVEV